MKSRSKSPPSASMSDSYGAMRFIARKSRCDSVGRDGQWSRAIGTRRQAMAKKQSGSPEVEQPVYSAIIEKVFFDHYKKGCTEFEFHRDELRAAAISLSRPVPDNLGDVLYSFKHRSSLPNSILRTASTGKEWVIEGAGRSRSRFKLARLHRITPSTSAYRIKVPDATPEVIKMHAKNDEQALLAKVRYNRLVDIFLRVTAYSLQNHLRTTVSGVGQIEIDELYVGVRDTGQQFVIPVQAKGGSDQIGATQVQQDIAYCRESYSGITPRAVAVQFAPDDVIVMFELAMQGEELKIVQERHYCLVGSGEIKPSDLKEMADLSD
jgi:hypothetical protein